MPSPFDRYGADVLSPQAKAARKPVVTELPLALDLVLEDPSSGFVGAVIRWENGLVVLEDRRGKRRSFPIGPGFWVDGKPVTVVMPKRKAAGAERTRSGSRAGTPTAAKVALPSRIFVEGKHDAELVEKIWGDDLRHVGVVVEFLNGIDDLPAIVDDFAPRPGRRLGVLVDHLLPGTKEWRIVEQVNAGRYGEYTFVTGHRFIDIWEAIRPERIGRAAWPQVPKGQDWKTGVCKQLGWPHASGADIGKVWSSLLGRVRSWDDLDTRLLTEVEKLIDFVTADHPQ
ncbi:DUF3097 domain-containing protein [Naumannella halotolerans]|uniref:DUF3097 family protein n=1 Tax=Naumannella halotolerans TaxID=993414 RepID=A0A4R7JBS3_9ACTN|nr:DUF3097 domain-containing protein [Naumannella halotolerans]TDT33899.1 Protein of unknown function (DUF3097) [Naumannella halotolerans]